MPEVLPTRVPNLLVNGSSGIAVGMATNIPPHNLTEVERLFGGVVQTQQFQSMVSMEHIQGPDFPTGGIINGRAGIVQAYRTGRGRIYVRGRAEVETDGKGREKIIITEIPFR